MSNLSENTIDTYTDPLDSFTRYLVSNGIPTQVLPSPASTLADLATQARPRLSATGTRVRMFFL